MNAVGPGVGVGVGVGVGDGAGVAVGAGTGVGNTSRVLKLIPVGSLPAAPPVPMNPNETLPPAGTSLFQAKVEPSN